MARSGYDEIAAEYYDPQHITSRNFDNATRAALKKNPFVIPNSDDELVLEIGAGRGRANDFLGLASACIVQLDNCKAMLEIPEREPCLLQVFADACDIPLVSKQFAAVVGFLVDPFIGLDCLAESYRMLKDDGRILLTVPTREWGSDLRKRLGIDVMTSRFKKIGKEDIVFLPSLLHSENQLTSMLAHTGFRDIEIHDCCLPADENPVSPDIKSVTDSRGIDIHQLPVIHTIRASR